MPRSLLLFDLQGGYPKENLLIKLEGFQLALLPARIVPGKWGTCGCRNVCGVQVCMVGLSLEENLVQ